MPVPAGTQIVGAPQLTFTYSGIGTSRSVYAQIVDDQTGLVLGNLATPIPVTLNGQTHTVSIALGTLADVAYTASVSGQHAYPAVGRLGHAVRESHVVRRDQRLEHDAFAANRGTRCGRDSGVLRPERVGNRGVGRPPVKPIHRES